MSHARDFGLESKNETLAAQLVWDYRPADLDVPDRALCDYAAKLTLAPAKVGPSDVETLRSHGFDDAQITIATQVIGYFNYINRIAEGLGVEPESWMTPSRDEWEQNKGRDYSIVA